MMQSWSFVVSSPGPLNISLQINVNNIKLRHTSTHPIPIVTSLGVIFDELLYWHMSWEHLDSPPKWVAKVAAEARGAAARGELDQKLLGTSRVYHGDTYVYKVDFLHENHGRRRRYYRQLKSDYFETTSEEGTCPNCQAYVRRMDGDEYLTCHRCGWQYKPAGASILNTIKSIFGSSKS
jgi:ribosomal protein L37AE/L43A